MPTKGQQGMKGTIHLEAQVAENTANIATLTTDLGKLAFVIGKMDDKIDELTVAVTRVQSPRRVEWLALVGTFVAVTVLFITIGGLVLVPIRETLIDIKAVDEREHRNFEEHEHLTLHPVGAEKVAGLEQRLDLIAAEGSPITQNRLVALEEKVKKLEAQGK
jgi:uncharacterized coiled-coil protein SlyX